MYPCGVVFFSQTIILNLLAISRARRGQHNNQIRFWAKTHKKHARTRIQFIIVMHKLNKVNLKLYVSHFRRKTNNNIHVCMQLHSICYVSVTIVHNIDVWYDEIFIHAMKNIYYNNVLLQIIYTISIVNIFLLVFLQ